MSRTLRDYQLEASAAVDRELETHNSTLVVAATGLGKSCLLADIAKRWNEKGAILWLAHRTELLDQAADHLGLELGYRPQVIQANREIDWYAIGNGRNVIVGSVQTLKNDKRLARLDHHRFAMLQIDESHHATAPTYRKIENWLRERNPGMKTLGVTATPKRTDKKALGIVFESVAYQMDAAPAIALGWLVDPIEERIIIEDVDFSEVPITFNELGEPDFSPSALEALMIEEGPLHAVAKPTLAKSEARSALVFTAGVAHAHLLAAIFNRERPGSAAALDGRSTPPGHPERERIMKDFKRGNLQYLCNYGICCLDDQTEILTRGGWKGIDQISVEDEVANWDQGRMWFAKPKALKIRERRPDEKMVVLETLRRSIRVTEDHRILYRTHKSGRFLVKHAQELIGCRCSLPVSGMMAPGEMDVYEAEPIQSSRPLAERITKNAWSLRKRNPGMSVAFSRQLASTRIADFVEPLRTQVNELSDDDCRWIGFWIGDGTKSKLIKSGVEYIVCQGINDTEIISWFENLSEMVGFTYRKRLQATKGGDRLVRWSFCRGTGFGPQQRRGGIYRLEPYLMKNGGDYLWSLTSAQFDAFLHGLWMADGDHGAGGPLPNGFRIYGSNRRFFDHLQAVAVCRGYRATLRKKDNHGYPLYNLSLGKVDTYDMAHDTLQLEELPWKNERVWCVTTDSSFLVSRRHGSVTVMGNTEGVDLPTCDMIVVARPTKSLLVLIQMVGRGLRPLAGVVDGHELPTVRRAAIAESKKPNASILYFSPKTANVKTATIYDALGGDYDDEVVALAKRLNDDEPGRAATERLEEAKFLYPVLAQNKLRQKLKAEVKWRAEQVGHAEGPAQAVSEIRRGGATDKQIEQLIGLGVQYKTAAAYTAKQAWIVTDKLRQERCTNKQRALLARFGEDPNVNYSMAKEIIDAIAKNGWRPREKVS